MAKGKSLSAMSHEQAHQALTFLVREGKLAESAVAKALERRERLIREVRERLAKLGVGGMELVGRAAKSAGARRRSAAKPARKARRRRISARARAASRRVRKTRGRVKPKASPRKKRVSATRKAAMVRQGKYLAAIRPLSAQDRAKVKAALASKGWSAAMAEAKGLAK